MALDPTWSMENPSVKLRPVLTRSGHSRWGGCPQVADLKEQPHRWVQRDSLVACQGQHLYVADRQIDRQRPPPGIGMKSIQNFALKSLAAISPVPQGKAADF